VTISTDEDAAARDVVLPTSVRDDRVHRWLAAVVVGLVMLPFVASAIALLGSAGADYHPYQDHAIIEWRTRDLFENFPLVGPYSRFDWFHPGPALFVVLALPYHLAGATSGALAFAALVVNAAAVLGALLIARRRGGLAMLVVSAAAITVLMHGLGVQLLRDVWNPHVTVLPFLLLAFVAWTMACGDRWAVPVAAGVATFLVQTHVGYALPALVLSVGGVGGLAWTIRRRPPRERPPVAGTLFASLAVLAVMWLPALLQQVDDEPGNLGELVRFFRDHGREQSYGTAWHVVADQLGVWPDWVRGATDLDVIGALDVGGGATLPVALALLVAAGVLAWRSRRPEALVLDLLAGALVVAAFVAVTRIVGEVFPYLVKWTWAVGALVWIAIAWSVVDAVRMRSFAHDVPVRRVALGAGVVVIAVLGVVCTVDAIDAGTPEPVASRRIARFTGAVEDELARNDRPGTVEIRMMDSPDSIFGGAGSLWTGAGIANLLDQRGVEVRVAPELGFAYTNDHVIGPGARRRLVVMPVDSPEVPRVDTSVWRELAHAGDTTLFVRDGAPG
jgi:hypothetical protein